MAASTTASRPSSPRIPTSSPPRRLRPLKTAAAGTSPSLTPFPPRHVASSFLEDSTPTEPNDQEDGGNSDDLSFLSAHAPRASMVENMALALDAFSSAPHHAEPAYLIRSNSYEWPTATRSRGHTFSSSLSSDIEIREPRLTPSFSNHSSPRASRRDSAMYRKNLQRLPSIFGEDEGSVRTRVYDAQRADHAAAVTIRSHKKTSSSAKSSGGSASSSIDLGHLANFKGRLGPPGTRRSRSFDLGSQLRLGRPSTMSGSVEVAPTPVIFAGPEAQRSPTKTSAPPVQLVVRKSSTRSSKSQHGRKPRASTFAVATAKTKPAVDAMPAMPTARHYPPSFGAAGEPGAPAGVPPDPSLASRPGFFRRVFGSSKNTPSQPDTGAMPPPSSTRPSQDLPLREANIPASTGTPHRSQKPPPALTDVGANKENQGVVNKKPSSFFRRRKKSVSNSSPAPMPLVLNPARFSTRPGEPSPVSSLRAFMDPYLANEAISGPARDDRNPSLVRPTGQSQSRDLIPRSRLDISGAPSSVSDHDKVESRSRIDNASLKAPSTGLESVRPTVTPRQVSYMSDSGGREGSRSPVGSLGALRAQGEAEIDDSTPIGPSAPGRIAEPARLSTKASASDVSDYRSAPSTPLVPEATLKASKSAFPSVHVSRPSLSHSEMDWSQQKARKIYDNADDALDQSVAARWLGDAGADRERVRVAFLQLFDFSSLTILAALRNLCAHILLRGESQQMDRLLDTFAKRWCECNSKHGFRSTDIVHTICYSILLLNTDLHLADIGQKMTKNQFVRNTMLTIKTVLADDQLALSRVSTGGAQSGTASRDETNEQDLGIIPASRQPTDRSDREDWSEMDVVVNSGGPLVDGSGGGSDKSWESQVEHVLRSFYSSISQEPLPLFGSQDHPSLSNSTFLSLGGNTLRRTPSTVSKAQSESQRGRLGLEAKSLGSRWMGKTRSRPRLPSGFSSSRTSLDGGSSGWSPSMSSTWSKNSMGKTLTSASIHSFETEVTHQDYQSSIGFANALSQAIIREDQLEMSTDELKSAPLLEDESLELHGAPWAKEGILKHKCHLEGVEKRSKDRNWNDCFAVVEKGWMRLFSFSMTAKSLRNKARSQKTSGVVGGGNWQDNAEEVWKFMLRHAIASTLPPPGYSKSRPYVWALSLPTGAVHLFSVGTPDIVKEFVSTVNFWSARLSKEPMMGGVSNMEYGWSDSIVNRALIGADSASRSQATNTSGRPSTQLSMRSSIDTGSSGSKVRLPGDRSFINEWQPPQQSMMASQLLEVDQLKALQAYVNTVEEELQKHNEMRGPMMLAFSPRHPNANKALSNWEKRSSYLLREIVKFRTYIDALQNAQSTKEKIYKMREEEEESRMASSESATSTAAAGASRERDQGNKQMSTLVAVLGLLIALPLVVVLRAKQAKDLRRRCHHQTRITMSSSALFSSPPPQQQQPLSRSIHRRSSRIPGGFDDDDHDGDSLSDSGRDDRDISHLDQHEPSSLLDSSLASNDQDHSTLPSRPVNEMLLQEREINKRLMDVESSFLPEPSTLANQDPAGKDDTFLFGVPTDPLGLANNQEQQLLPLNSSSDVSATDHLEPQAESRPGTSSDKFKTPLLGQDEFAPAADNEGVNTPTGPNTSALEHLSSPPSAAIRTVSRMQSMATMAGYETASEDTDLPSSPSKRPVLPSYANDSLSKKRQQVPNVTPSLSITVADVSSETGSVQQFPSKRPKYLRSRSSAARLSYDSMASSNTDASDVTLGADFALQSGGALPDPKLDRKATGPLSRQASLGSLMSGTSGLSDDDGRPGGNHLDLSKIEEESPGFQHRTRSDPAGPITPKASASNLVMPTDTVIAKNVRDIEVPGTFARQYLQERSQSPSRALPIAGLTPGPKRGLTLKEHRSTVEKLGKENFDLKMKIHFLDQALQKRSEEGIKEMITENVQLKSDRMRLEKDNFNLRKQVRELQKKLNEARDSPSADPGYGTDDDRSLTAEEELFYLRERIETNELEIEKLRAESLAKETEKRRLAEMVRSLGDARTGSSDVGSREERDMWKDMLEAETIAREQSEEENKKLRDEIAKLKHDTLTAGRANSRKSRATGSLLSRSSSVERNNELERLRHEVSELQKTISAQASALTSRNKEKERLYQEIEDLKLGRMGGGTRSIAGDSILDRSASRARSHSRASNGHRFSPMSDQERDGLETKINDLRDEVSQLKLNNTGLQNELDEAIAELDAVDAQAQADADQFNDELRILTQERDNALRDAEEQDQAFQQLKNEAQDEIDGLGDELDAKVEECERLQQELRAHAQTVRDLQTEMRAMGDGLRRLEEDAHTNLTRYESVKTELDDANRDLEKLENNLNDAQTRIQRMTVQQESHLSQIAFLREEQDADKIKISDFESLLKKTHINLESERQRSAELQRRLEEERQQREMLASKKEKDVQKMITDLNREATSAREELRNIRKTLAARETDLASTRDRLSEFENHVRHIVNDPSASSRSLTSAITKMQTELAQATADLDSTRSQLNEREALLANRDQLLESSSLECRKLQDALDRERQARSQDKHSFEQALKSHQASARALTQNRNKVAELENARNADRKRLVQLEQQFKEQLAERNQVLLSLWKKLSSMCGPDWAHNNSLINGNLPSQEVVGNMLFWPGFSRNLLLAAKQVEGTINAFRDKIKRVDRELYKDYQNLEHILDLRLKKLERIEASWEQMKLKMHHDRGSFGPDRANIVEHLAGFTNAVSEYPSPIRSNSTSSKHSYTTGFAMQDRREGLIIPAGPFNAPANGNFSLPPTNAPTRDPPAPPSTNSREDGSDVGSLRFVECDSNSRTVFQRRRPGTGKMDPPIERAGKEIEAGTRGQAAGQKWHEEETGGARCSE
ncbi:hypothetical protein DV738_g1912, partial [Chaetothyriales sp. CBS 135597]